MLQTFDKGLYDFITINKLNEAIEKNDIALYYHPKIKINSINKNYEIQGVEALIRWFDAEKGYIRPDIIIYVANKKGFIDELGKWILKKSFRDIKKIQHCTNKNLKLSLNISLEQLKDINFINNLMSISDENKFELSNLELDIVDSIDNMLSEYLKPVFRKLKSVGISIILDDYGSYHECLEFVTSNAVDGIKLDKYIITNLQKDNTIKNVVDNLHILGKKVIAEGVETEEQYETVRFYGCDEAQGYFWYNPLALHSLCDLIK